MKTRVDKGSACQYLRTLALLSSSFTASSFGPCASCPTHLCCPGAPRGHRDYVSTPASSMPYLSAGCDVTEVVE